MKGTGTARMRVWLPSTLRLDRYSPWWAPETILIKLLMEISMWPPLADSQAPPLSLSFTPQPSIRALLRTQYSLTCLLSFRLPVTRMVGPCQDEARLTATNRTTTMGSSVGH